MVPVLGALLMLHILKKKTGGRILNVIQTIILQINNNTFLFLNKGKRRKTKCMHSHTPSHICVSLSTEIVKKQ
jgi:hypothetical protein